MNELKLFLTGWTNYFQLGLYKSRCETIDSWIRHKIRIILWKHWKTTKQRVKMQRKHSKVRQKWANSRLGPTRVAKRELNFTLRDEVLTTEYNFIGLNDILKGIMNKKSKSDMHSQLTLFEL